MMYDFKYAYDQFKQTPSCKRIEWNNPVNTVLWSTYRKTWLSWEKISPQTKPMVLVALYLHFKNMSSLYITSPEGSFLGDWPGGGECIK